jgi:hypothetical protein
MTGTTWALTSTLLAQALAWEPEAPGVGTDSLDQVISSSDVGARRHQTQVGREVVTGARAGVGAAGQRAREGHVEVRRHAGESAKRSVQVVTQAPARVVHVGGLAVATARNGATARARARQTSAEAISQAHQGMAAARQEAKADQEALEASTREGTHAAWDGAKEGFGEAGDGVIQGTEGVGAWAREESAVAWGGATAGTLDHTREAGGAASSVASFFGREAQRAVADVGGLPRQAWSSTERVASQAWSSASREGRAAYQAGGDGSQGATRWLQENRDRPVEETQRAVDTWSRWNVQMGWDRGARAGAQSAAQAWENDDQVMSGLWATSGLAKGAWHLLVLMPAVTPIIVGSGLGTALALHALELPVVALARGLGVLAAGAAFGLGALLTGSLAAVGVLAAVASAGWAVLRAVAAAAVGGLVTGLTAAGGLAVTAVVTGLQVLRLLGVPPLAFTGLLGVVGANTLRLGVREAWSGLQGTHTLGRAAAGTGLVAARLAGRTTGNVAGALAVGVLQNGVVVPWQDAQGGVRFLAETAVALGEGPVAATQAAAQAGAKALATGAGAAADLGAGLGRGAVRGAAEQASAWGLGALALAAGAARTGQFAAAAVDIPRHRAWAEFRRPEAEQVAALAARQEGQEPAEVVLVRASWWGADEGKTRFFVTRDPATGRRTYFRRDVDPATCQVVYRHTQRDPWARDAVSAWQGEVRPGLVSARCAESRESDPGAGPPGVPPG